ncbi:polysaccharide deacetylase family protein [Paenibacillus albiflavus]|uniref:Polysaccharide deacetylase family protein n=1 Tax=Paenibacillus albiflavus TaxID=2545760 RepID=A0A4R4EI18_9BACL|nr:polysaccharide deacetylase family protein [Paenibacillus albiflavus]TCZ77828.1 polysaccharide deacetylase family protein [Paenibacillus albiflavus]
MHKLMLSFIFLIVVFYMIVPYCITRIFGVWAFKKAKHAKQIAFTFDDGPNPLYTPQLLDLLHKHGIKATFFVLGSKAEQYPDLIKRMYKEGHQIGIHNYRHVANWMMTPVRVRNKQVDRTADIIEQITGERPHYYRPPWGCVNLGDLLLLRKTYRIILWSIMAWDWKPGGDAGKLKQILMKNLKPGSIILLHDSGDTPGADLDAPEFMLEALREVLQEIKPLGYECVRVDQLMEAEQAQVGTSAEHKGNYPDEMESQDAISSH